MKLLADICLYGDSGQSWKLKNRIRFLEENSFYRFSNIARIVKMFLYKNIFSYKLRIKYFIDILSALRCVAKEMLMLSGLFKGVAWPGHSSVLFANFQEEISTRLLCLGFLVKST